MKKKNAAKTNAAKTNAAKTNAAKMNAAKTNAAKTNAAKTTSVAVTTSAAVTAIAIVAIVATAVIADTVATVVVAVAIAATNPATIVANPVAWTSPMRSASRFLYRRLPRRLPFSYRPSSAASFVNFLCGGTSPPPPPKCGKGTWQSHVPFSHFIRERAFGVSCLPWLFVGLSEGFLFFMKHAPLSPWERGRG